MSPLAANDSAKMISDVEALRAERVGGIVVSPVDPAALAPSLQKAMWSGTYVSTVVAPPATSLLNAPQYLTGKELGDAAVARGS
ncbi:substrate-binding domain-containing protein [Mesorhizobium japonicum]|uniref:substrate-binding domain-containing protein n=1 Tax=Mesorhizobium japonicum TaxID=2066070 RepID=UPI000304FEB4|nr:substrate-binding domain-containing protein [Mesorhizobium japonicum]